MLRPEGLLSLLLPAVRLRRLMQRAARHNLPTCQCCTFRPGECLESPCRWTLMRARRACKSPRGPARVLVLSSRAVPGDQHSSLSLVLVVKPGCSLCDSLEDKLRSVLDAASFIDEPLSRVTLETQTDPDSLDAPRLFLRDEQQTMRPPPFSISPRMTASKLSRMLTGWIVQSGALPREEEAWALQPVDWQKKGK